MGTNAISSAASLSGWRARALHTITLPSGQRVRIRLPGIATLLEHGDLSEELFEIAIAELTDTISVPGIDSPSVIPGSVQWATKEVTTEEKLKRIATYGRFQRELVCVAVEEIEVDGEWQPFKLALDDLDALPEDDLSLIADIVQRIRFRDARGVRIGVEPLERWATFRQGHKGIACTGDEDCPGCESVRQSFSSLDLDPV
jgi:hypothetical protein